MHYESPLGILEITFSEDRVSSLKIKEKITEEVKSETSELELKLRGELDEYFQGKRKVFSLKLSFEECTFFQQQVLEYLLKIPYGETFNYKQIAQMLGKANSARAVGRACALNPILLLIPCHRVIASDGSLSGYAAGKENKIYLLEHERLNR